MYHRLVYGLPLVGMLALGSTALANEPIKIGVMFPLTGPIAANGGPTRDAVKLAFDEVGNQVAGRRIELIFEDSAGKPDIGLTKIKSLVERNKVDLLLSELTSSVGASVAPYVISQKIPWLSTISLSSLTRDLKSSYIFRFAPSSYQFGIAGAESAKKLGWKKAYFIGWNAPVSRESFEAVKKVFGDGIVDAMFPNVGTPDFAPYLTKVDPSKADGVFVAVWGSDAPRITQQFAEYGLSKKMQFFGLASFTSEELLANMPPESEGIFSSYPYCGTLDTPENRAFVSAYKAKYNALPGSYQYLGYQAAKMLIQAIEDVKGKVQDREALTSALAKVQANGPMGVTKFDENRGIVTDFFLLKVAVGSDGKLHNICTDRIPQVRDPYELFPK
jgi:branched-chain amino acid transport system substrate-binding protein